MRGNASDKSKNMFACARVKCCTARVSRTLTLKKNLSIHALISIHPLFISKIHNYCNMSSIKQLNIVAIWC